MTSKTVSITISAKDNFSQVMSRYNQAMGRAATETKQVGAASSQAQSGFGMLKGAAVALGGAFVAMHVGQTALEMVSLGREVKTARGVFEALSGGVGEAAINLQLMRDATHNTVADLDLMSSSNKLLQMGIAETGQEAARLTEIAVSLGRAMGQDANEAVTNFALTLANTSMPRLDALGISAGNVRKEIARLQTEFRGMSREEAFKLAVLSEGDEAMARIAETSAATGTSLERVEAAWANFWADSSEQMATWAIDIATGFEDAAQAAEDWLARMKAQGVFRDQQQDIAGEAANVATDGRGGPDMGRHFETIRAMLQGGGIATAGDQGALPFDADAIVREYEYVSGALDGVTRELLVNGLAEYLGQVEEIEDRREQNVRTIERDTQNLIASYGRYLNIQRESLVTARQLQAAEESRTRIVGGMRPRYGAESRGLLGEAEAAAAGMGEFVDPAQAAAMAAMADQMATLYDLASQNELISDGELDRIGDARDRVQELADAAQEGADAFARMTLPQAFGQGQGGMQGEVNAMVLEQMRAGGASEDQIAAFERAGALATGEQTTASLAFTEEIAPLIARATTELGPQVGVALTEAVTNYLRENAGEATRTGMLGSLTGAGLIVGQGGGQQITVRPGDTINGLAAQYGMSPEQVMAATGTTNPRLLQPGTYSGGAGLGFDFGGGSAGMAGGYAMFVPEGEQTTAGNLDPASYAEVATSTEEISGYLQDAATYAEQWRSAQSIVNQDVQAVTDNLTVLTGDVQEVEVAISFTGDIATLKALMNGDMSLSATVNVDGDGGGGGGNKNNMRTTTRDNYGTPPGVDPRVVGPRGL